MTFPPPVPPPSGSPAPAVLPAPLRRVPFLRPGWSPGVHEARTATVLGRLAGGALGVCFVTGLISHLLQHPGSWPDPPGRPVWGYQLSQGVHVAAGIAAVPLVLAKLWVVYPRLFQWPPVRGAGHALQRLLIAPLVAGTLFQLVTGLANIVQWYPWGFFFPATHWAVAWVVLGALLVHVAAKAPRARGGRRPAGTGPDGGPRPERGTGSDAAADPPHGAGAGADEAAGDGVLSRDRRALLFGLAAATSAVTVATVGQTVAPLTGVSLLAPRRVGFGPQGVPVNRTAAAAAVADRARDPGWRLRVREESTGRDVLSLSLPDLLALPQHTAALPIACVEGWSTLATWSGVRLRDVLDLAGVAADRRLRAVSLEATGLYGASVITASAARDPLTLLALRLNGSALDLDHGYPVRLIAANRPGVGQTKWLSAVEVMSK